MKILSLILSILIVTSCAEKATLETKTDMASTPHVSSQIASSNAPSFNELRFTQKPLIKLDVKRLEFISKYEPPFRPPNVEHLMPFAPERAMRRWAEDRLSATGKSDIKAVIQINDASVIEENEAGGGLFGGEDKDHYTARLDVEIQIVDMSGEILAKATAYSWRKHTLLAKTSLDDREKSWSGMVRKLAINVDEKLEDAINKYLAPYIVK